MADTEMRVYDWDDEITTDGYASEESVVLPKGNYPFEVIKTEKFFYDGKGSLPACNAVKVYLRVDGGDLGKALCVENLYLCEKMEWKAASFFRSIGLKKHGEPIKWRLIDHADGERGRCSIYVDTYTSNGQERQNNKIDRFFDPSEPAAPKKTFTKGSF